MGLLTQKWKSFCLVAASAFFSISAAPSDGDWIEKQISGDLQYLSTHPTTTRALKKRFQTLAKQSNLILYCKIRKNLIKWETSPGLTDWYKANPIFAYFSELSKKKDLPDTDFIFCIEDGMADTQPKEGPLLSQLYLLRGQQPLPIFGFCKLKNMKNALLFPDWNMFSELLESERSLIARSAQYADQYPWDTKQSVAFFRGSDTGHLDPSKPNFGNERVHMAVFSHAHPELVDAGLPQIHFEPLKRWYQQTLGSLPSYSSHQQLFKYKYLLDIDGNASTFERCRLLLLSNSVLVKINSYFEQWYYKALTPWRHYVPIKQDLSNLESQLNFLQNNDLRAEKIADSGRRLAEVIFSSEKVDEYVDRLLWAYSNYVSLN